MRVLDSESIKIYIKCHKKKRWTKYLKQTQKIRVFDSCLYLLEAFFLFFFFFWTKISLTKFLLPFNCFFFFFIDLFWERHVFFSSMNAACLDRTDEREGWPHTPLKWAWKGSIKDIPGEEAEEGRAETGREEEAGERKRLLHFRRKKGVSSLSRCGSFLHSFHIGKAVIYALFLILESRSFSCLI